MANLFKTRYIPNADGTDSTEVSNDANTVFVHTYLGDDNTGDGTGAKPYRSVTKANLKSGVSYIVFRGVINEAFSGGKIIIGDDINQILMTTNYTVNSYQAKRLSTTAILPTRGGATNNMITFSPITISYFNNYNNVGGGKYCLCVLFGGTTELAEITDNTNNTFNVVSNNNQCHCVNSIIVKSLSTVNGVGKIKNTIMPSSIILKYGSAINIILPNFTNDSKQNILLLKNAFVNAGMTQVNVDSLFPKDSFGNETCIVIKEERDGGIHPNIFNKYDATLTGTITAAITANQAKTSIQLTVADSSKFASTGDIFVPNTAGDGYEVFTYTSVTINSGTLITFNGASYTFKVAHSNGATCKRYGEVLDFTLNPVTTNEALWASNTGGYVGCFRPAVDGIINTGNPIINVNADGSDDVASGTLMVIDASGNLVFQSSAQTWNRLKDQTTINIPIGSNFKGLSAMSQDGSPFGHYLGKKQNLIDTTAVNPGDALTVGKMYKVYNDSAQDVTRAIIYNGIQYLPEFTFMCIAGVTVFSLLNVGSGSYVKKVLADVLESIDILPYDNANTPSVSFPRFSAPLMGECKLLYYTAAGATRYGKIAGNPVLFGDLAVANMITDFGSINNQISYYNGYAISNADQEFFTLANPELTSPKSTYFTAAIPTLRYLRREINGHFDEPYDY